MTKLAAVFLFVAAAMAPPADVTPQGPPPIVGTSAVIGPYTVELVGLQECKDGVLRVWLRSTRKDPVHGELDLLQQLAVGDSLGVARGTLSDTSGSGDQTKLHIAISRDPQLSFDPRATIVSMKQHPDWVVRLCHLATLPDGLGCVELEKRRVPIRVNEVVLQVNGKWNFTIRNSSPPGKMPTDLICTVHGGRIPARTLSETESQEAKAGFLLASADEEWKSRSPKVRRKAQEAYVKLLKAFTSTSVVSKNRERIKTRSEETIED